MIEDISFGKEIALGLGIGLLFIILNATLGLVIGIPTLALSSETEKMGARYIVAPLGEEIVFRAFLPFMLMTIGFPFIIVLMIDVIAFSVFHFVAYGSSLIAASSLFIGAGLFGLVAFLSTYWDSDIEEFQIPIAAIIGHAIANIWLGLKESGALVIGL